MTYVKYKIKPFGLLKNTITGPHKTQHALKSNHLVQHLCFIFHTYYNHVGTNWPDHLYPYESEFIASCNITHHHGTVSVISR